MHNQSLGRFICIGASAGGLQALERFFRQVPSRCQDTFVIIQHLSPDFKSVMGEILNRYTDLPCLVIEDGSHPQKASIHLIPPGKSMVLSEGVFHLQNRHSDERHLPINDFFKSLNPETMEFQVTGIIFSGTGSDGSEGIQALKKKGGNVLVQSTQSSQFPGMPHSAMETGVIDFVGGPEEICTFLYPDSRPQSHFEEQVHERTPRQKIFDVLAQKYGVDFSLYKKETIERRLHRRIQLSDFSKEEEYAATLSEDAAERDRLYRDLLIDVTSFFRDPAVFEKISDSILLPGLRGLGPKDEYRIWVAACATGEEAYSLAILCHKAAEKTGFKGRMRIFATDAHHDSIRRASSGVFAAEALKNLSPEDLDRYFEKKENAYRVRPDIRRMLAFAPHNLLQDPPLLNMHLVTCRNLLIYFMSEAQNIATQSLSIALKLNGHLVLGVSESLLPENSGLQIIDNRLKIFRKTRDIRRQYFSASAVGVNRQQMIPLNRLPVKAPPKAMDTLYAAVLQTCVPAGLLINAQNELVHTFGDASRFMNITGQFKAEIGSFLTGNLRIAVATSIERVRKSHKTVSFGDVQHTENGKKTLLSVSARPVFTQDKELFFFLEIHEQDTPQVEVNVLPSDEISHRRIEDLERELQEARENLQTTVEELETSNEELQAANEELLASNEELQSTNEELQSVNEELHSVNAEYSEKNQLLNELNEDLTNFMKSTDIGTLFLNTKLEIRRFTPAATRLFSLRDQDIGRPLDEINSRMQQTGELQQVLQTVLDTAKPYEDEVDTTDGQLYLRRIAPYRDSQHQIQGLVLSFINLTHLRDLQRREEASHELKRSILDAISSNLCVIDANGNVLETNEGWRHYALKNGAEDGLDVGPGANYFAACAMAASEPAYSEAQAALKGIKKVLSGQTPRFELEYGCHSPHRPAWYLMRVTPLRRPSGGAVIAHIDITKLKQAQAEALESESRFKDLANQAPVGVLQTTVEGRIDFLNAYWSRHLGITDIIEKGCTLQEVFQSRNGSCLQATQEAIFQTLKPQTMEISLGDPDGQSHYLLVLTPRLDAHGALLGLIGAATNITERIRVEEELRAARTEAEKASHAKTSFLASMSHEIRTPLNAVIGMSSLLSDYELSPDIEGIANTIAESGESLLALINNILDFSKIEAGHMQLNLSPFSLDAVERRIMAIARVAAANKGLNIEFHIAPHLRQSYHLDGPRLIQVLLNLVSNAIKFTDSGYVKIEVLGEFLNEDYCKLMFRVCDTGTGMNEEQQKRVFDSFQQVLDSSQNHYQGTGLGLSISSRLIELMGGNIQCQSTPGEGTCFSFEIHALKCSSEQAPKTLVHQLPKAGTRELAQKMPLDILYVEDTRSSQELMQRILERMGYTLDIASNGHEALEYLQIKQYDLIFMDMQMPGMDGLQTTTAIRKLSIEEGQGPRIVGLTANATLQDRQKCFEAGMNQYLPKPVRHDDILQVLLRLFYQEEDSLESSTLFNPDELESEMRDCSPQEGLQFLEELFEGWYQESSKLIRHCHQAAQNEDSAGLIQILHKLKGGAAGMGMPRLQNFCRQWESRLGNTEQIMNSEDIQTLESIHQDSRIRVLKTLEQKRRRL